MVTCLELEDSDSEETPKPNDNFTRVFDAEMETVDSKYLFIYLHISGLIYRPQYKYKTLSE